MSLPLDIPIPLFILETHEPNCDRFPERIAARRGGE
jgi:hypothetical protein